MSSSTSTPQETSSTASDTGTGESTTGASSSSTPTDSTSATPAEQQETATGTPESGQEPPEEPQAAPGDDKASKARQEAAKYRKRAQAAETERDQALEQVAELRQALLGSALERRGRGVTLDALNAAGHDTAALFDGATLDGDKFSAAVADTAKRFNIRIGIVPTQGTGDPAPRPDPAAKGWSDAFREVTGNRNPAL